MHFAADMVGVPVDRPADLESTASRPAFAAGWRRASIQARSRSPSGAAATGSSR